MNNETYPEGIITEKSCPRCGDERIQSGGYRERKLRDIGGIKERQVKKLRCSTCKKPRGCIYPEDTLRHSWYSDRVHGLVTILDVHQTKEGCIEEVADLLEYPLTQKTRDSWQESRERRIESNNKEANAVIDNEDIGITSIDEFKMGKSWGYTLTDVLTMFVLTYNVATQRSFLTVRDMLAKIEPKVVISDGCKVIAAALAWFKDIKVGRCWFHVIKSVVANTPKELKDEMKWDLEFLYTRETIPEAERFLRILLDRYETSSLMPLLNAWHNLKAYWRIPNMPLTNNASEQLYSAITPRRRKRDKRTEVRQKAYLAEIVWRHNHKPRHGFTPYQRITGDKEKNRYNKQFWWRALIPGAKKRGHTIFT